MPRYRQVTLVHANYTIRSTAQYQPINFRRISQLGDYLGTLPCDSYKSGGFEKLQRLVLAKAAYKLVSFEDADAECIKTSAENGTPLAEDDDLLPHTQHDDSWYKPLYGYIRSDGDIVYFDTRSSLVGNIQHAKFTDCRAPFKGGTLLQRREADDTGLTLTYDPFKAWVNAVASESEPKRKAADAGAGAVVPAGDRKKQRMSNGAVLKAKPETTSRTAAAADVLTAKPKDSPKKTQSAGAGATQQNQAAASASSVGLKHRLGANPQDTVLTVLKAKPKEQRKTRPKLAGAGAAQQNGTAASAGFTGSKHRLHAKPGGVPTAVTAKPKEPRKTGVLKPKENMNMKSLAGSAAADNAGASSAHPGAQPSDVYAVQYSADDDSAVKREYKDEVDKELAKHFRTGGGKVEVYDLDYAKRGDEWKDPEGNSWEHSSWWCKYVEDLNDCQAQLDEEVIGRPEHDTLTKNAFATMVKSGMVQAPAAIKEEIAEELAGRKMSNEEFYKRLAGAIIASRLKMASKRSDLISKHDILEQLMQLQPAGATCVACKELFGYGSDEHDRAKLELAVKPTCLCFSAKTRKNNVLLTYCLPCALKHAGNRTPHNPGCMSVLFTPGKLSNTNSIRLTPS